VSEKRAFGWRLFMKGSHRRAENKRKRISADCRRFFKLYTFDFNENSYDGVKNTEGLWCAAATEYMETITNAGWQGGGWYGGDRRGCRAVRSNFKRKYQKLKGGNAFIFSFDLPEHAKRDLRIKHARRKLYSLKIFCIYIYNIIVSS